jgi:hypothetical protein
VTGCSACGSCSAPSAVAVTKTIDWEDVDGLAASRVPIPSNYHGFSPYNPAQNKVYRSGPPPVSVGNGVQVAYAGDGKFGLGAEGFVIDLKSFWILTFLDPDNGVTEATLRVSGQLVSNFIVSQVFLPFVCGAYSNRVRWIGTDHCGQRVCPDCFPSHAL